MYSHAGGELIDMIVAEGMPVKEGDLIARIKAPGAIQAATNAIQAKLTLEKAEKDKTTAIDKAVKKALEEAEKAREEEAAKQEEPTEESKKDDTQEDA